MPIVIEHPTAEAIFAALQQVPAEELVRLRALMERSVAPVNRSTSWSDEDLQEFSDAGLESEGLDLRARGINRAQAAELRASFASFTDWNEPEMDIYDDYDAAKNNL